MQGNADHSLQNHRDEPTHNEVSDRAAFELLRESTWKSLSSHPLLLNFITAGAVVLAAAISVFDAAMIGNAREAAELAKRNEITIAEIMFVNTLS